MQTYSSERKGPAALWREARHLFVLHRRGADARVDQKLAIVGEVEAEIARRYGMVLDKRSVLDIGPGQQLIELSYFALRNRAVGIDLDVIARGFDPRPYAQMLRVNGVHRTAKTVVRKAVGIDARYARALRRRLGCRRLPRVRVEQMDIADLTFPDASFDFVYCASVVQHIPDPAVALRQMSRVLLPGGVAYASLQLYTSETGSWDPRLFGADRGDIPFWAHLRDGSQRLSGNAFLNQLRLPEWRDVFAAQWPGCNIDTLQPERAQLEPIATELQRNGELTEYSLDELLTHELRVTWQRPS
jgi:SAM-dependent methyltransferase